MNKKLAIIASATGIIAALLYFIKTKQQKERAQIQLPAHRSRHRTEVFANAKTGL
ncbi:MAG: hypothetical protein JWR61_4540 [Ferruginibacter sp.]|uniref:hypothetical protein n=1 Tax=Ferruginibacter sp. TaxID=1940288 RepID=UPI0026583B4E|nr:hypothetical protein [Ferruginibacter sp.]MDB5279585.1 hypothetical protein [Ferruginibacter sp.]